MSDRIPITDEELITHIEKFSELMDLRKANIRKIQDLMTDELAHRNLRREILAKGRLPHDSAITDTGGPRLTVNGERDVAKEQLEDLKTKAENTKKQLKEMRMEYERLDSRIEEMNDWFKARRLDPKTGEELKGRKKLG